MLPLRLTAYTVTSALGAGLTAHRDALRHMRSGIVRKAWETVEPMCLGEVEGVDEVVLRSDLLNYDCRNNRLAQLALEQDGFIAAANTAIAQYGATRIGLFLGTSTSGILTSEIAYRHRDTTSGGALPANYRYRETHNAFSVSDFVRKFLKLEGPAAVISTACSSSAKVFATAHRLIALGLIDAAIVGGVDSLCLTTLYGFSSLQLVSSNPCKPFDANRDGISAGEGGAFVLLERADKFNHGDILLTGIGETSDAHHMSSPHPEGLGARNAMLAALNTAALKPADIDYINLHGTATPSNDAAEDAAVIKVFGTDTPSSSTKGYTGHTLGAAGGIEAVICAIALHDGFIPGGVGTEHIDERLHCNYIRQTVAQPLRHVLSNSFGFGGSNCSLIFSRVPT